MNLYFRMLFYKLVICCCLIIVGTTFLLGQSTLLDQQVYSHQLFDEKDAWRSSSGFVNTLTVTDNGMLWIGAHNGLLRWDGNNRILYDNTPNNKFRILGEKVNRILERPNGDLVLSTQEGELQIELLRKGTSTSEKITTNKESQKVKGYLADIVLSDDQEIYAAFNEGDRLSVYRLEDNHLSLVHTFSFEFNIDQIKLKITPVGDAFFIAFHGIGVWSCEGDQLTKVMDFAVFPNGSDININFFFLDQKKRLWLGLSIPTNNVFLWNDNVFLPYHTPLQFPVDKIKEDTLGQLLFIAGRYPDVLKEVYFHKEKQWLDYSSYIDSNIQFIHPSKDVSKLLFATTKDNITAIEFNTQRVKTYLEEELPENEWGHIIRGIQEDEFGDIYFLDEAHHFYKLDKRTDVVTEIPILDSTGNVVDFKCSGAIHRDQFDQLWFKVCDGNSRGILVHYQPITNVFSFYYHPELIRDFTIGDQNKIWVTHHSAKDRQGKLSQFDIAQKQFVDVDLGTLFAEPRYLYAQNDSVLWMGTIKGLVEINTKQITAEIFTTENSTLYSDNIIAIAKGPDNYLMMGTYGNGLQLFDPDRKKVLLFDHKNGLRNNFVCGMISVEENHYWISTFDGLVYFDWKERTFTDFGVEDGFSHHEFNRYAFYQAKDGTNYLGTVNGLNAFRTEVLKPDRSDIRISLSGIKRYYGNRDTVEIEQANLETLEEISLSPDLTYIEFDFYSTDFAEQNSQKIFTRLIPYDDDWVYAEDQSVRYRLLPPGKYRLEVKGTLSPEILKFDLISELSFFRTFWFGLLVVGSLIGLIAGGMLLRIKNTHRKERADAAVSRQFAQLELKALQAQLNPHFVFNALGAIQYYIQMNDVEVADDYLTRFARLMRKYLDSSKEKMIPLKEEIELLTIYTDLEKLRFEDLFSVEITIEKNMQIEDIYLPSMLIQPFIENAINHGLTERRDGKGLLSIHFSEREPTLYCEIKDNGIGRKNAQKNKRKGHKSRGMGIIEEKIQTLKLSGIADIAIDIKDLDIRNEAFQGTHVILKIKKN